MRPVLAISLLGLSAACAPVPVSPERAEALCRQEVGQADGVSGNVGVGVGVGGGSSGAKAKGSITVTDRVFNPQTEQEFLAECIARRVNGEPAPTTVGITIGASS